MGEQAGTAYLVMEFIEGANLAELMVSGHPPNLSLSLEIAHQAFQKAWKIKPPYVLAMIELEEGPRLMSNLINIEPSPKAVKCDMPVEVVFTKVSDDVTLPLFQPRR